MLFFGGDDCPPDDFRNFSDTKFLSPALELSTAILPGNQRDRGADVCGVKRFDHFHQRIVVLVQAIALHIVQNQSTIEGRLKAPVGEDFQHVVDTI